ncbi:MAG TPA: energy-coupling factor transporter transmembrane component T [Solirubrobacteraceae bacterium]|nr:energy-coupling factor transporter transmembrane component T [Solirubrobacteraceae bacterium]
MIYERRASPLHAARATASGAWCVALAVAALAFHHPLVLGALLFAVLAGARGAGVGRDVARILRYAVPFALFIALINPFVSRNGLTVVARLGEIPPFGEVDLTLEALVYGAMFGLRLLVVVLAFAVATYAVDPDEVLRLFRRVSFRSALTAALAVRLVPVLHADARRLAEARRCRAGGDASRLAILRAVAAGALDRATDVAATLEVRGYATAAPSRAAGRPWSRHDVWFLASAGAVLALVVAATVLGVADFQAFPALVVPAGAVELAFCGALVLVALLPFADRRGIAP